MTPSPLVAVVGSPNAGKSALFNALTGARQKVGNYPGVTVERKSGRLVLTDGRPAELVDLPGAYSLDPASPDEAVTRDVLMGAQQGERRPDALLIVLDASNLDNHLRFALQLIELGIPTVVALNMIDLAKRDGLRLDSARLAADLGVPVVETVAVRRRGIAELTRALDDMLAAPRCAVDRARAERHRPLAAPGARDRHRGGGQRDPGPPLDAIGSIRCCFTRSLGPIILALLMFVMFQAVFAWSETPVAWIEDGVAWLGDRGIVGLPPGLFRSLIVDGVIGGVGAVIVFLPQILILFFFILLLEGTGYMVRAAFLMDRLMHGVGLSGRAFIPLLSSFACAVPGIMATRTIDDPKDRLTTILIAPLMTCSARLPVYTLIIAAFIPDRAVGPGVGLQGLVMFVLYIGGIFGALAVALVLRRGMLKGSGGGFMMELPKYQWPSLKDVAIGLWQRASDLPQARRHDHPRHHHRPVGAGQLPAGRPGRETERGFDRRQDRRRDRGRGPADRLQPRHCACPAPRDGRARGRGERDRHGLFDRCHRTRARRSSGSSRGWRAAGACRPRWLSSPGSCSRRNASRPSPSPAAKPMAGAGRYSW